MLSLSSSLKTNLENVIKEEDKDNIYKQIEILNDYTAPLAEKVMDATIKEALKGKKL